MNAQWCYSHHHSDLGFHYRGWAYPQGFPNPPPYIELNSPNAQLWFDNLNQLYPPTDPNRYHRAWVSWFDAKPGQVWNGHEHIPNFGPYAPRPMTQQVAHAADIAAVNWAAHEDLLSPVQYNQSRYHPVMSNELVQVKSDRYVTIAQPYILSPQP